MNCGRLEVMASPRHLQILYFTKSINKGTIHTAEMLVEARSEEGLAAVWIAATAKELYNYRIGSDVGRYADMLHMAAYEFLSNRYFCGTTQ
jgi:hypothetical protein